jgi:hypothetical protein
VRVFASRAQLIAGESFADATCYGTNSRLQTLTSTVNPSAARALRRMLAGFAPDVVQVQMFLWQLSPSILPLLRDVPSVYWAMTFKAVCPTGLKWLPGGAPCAVRAGTVCLTNGCITLTGFGPADAPARALAPPARRVRHDRELLARRASPARSGRDRVARGDLARRARGIAAAAARRTAHGHLCRTPHRGEGTRRPRARLRPRPRARAECRLSIAGAGPAEPALRALVHELGIAEAVVLHGQLGGDALERTLERGWVHRRAIALARAVRTDRYGSDDGGTAVVASEIGGWPRASFTRRPDCAWPAGDELALADALTRVLADRDLRRAAGGGGGGARAQERFS